MLTAMKYSSASSVSSLDNFNSFSSSIIFLFSPRISFNSSVKILSFSSTFERVLSFFLIFFKCSKKILNYKLIFNLNNYLFPNLQIPSIILISGIPLLSLLLLLMEEVLSLSYRRLFLPTIICSILSRKSSFRFL